MILLAFAALTYGGVTPFSTLVVQAIITATLLVVVTTRLRRNTQPLGPTRIDAPLGALLIYATLSWLWSIDPFTTLGQLHRFFALAVVFPESPCPSCIHSGNFTCWTAMARRPGS